MITDLIRLQAGASPETNQKSYCDEETSKATEKEDRDLLSVVYKNAVDSRRASWRVITSVEQKEKSKSEEQLASYAREHIAKVENELQKIREGVLALMDKKLVPSPSTDESKAFYYKMKSDYHRYLAVQDTEVPKTSSRNRTLQRAAEQIPNVPVPETFSRDGVQQRTVEQIVDAPVPQAVEELAEVSKVFSQDRVQQRFGKQTIEPLLFHLLRESSRHLTLGRKIRHNMLSTRTFNTSSTQLKWRGPNSPKRQFRRRSTR